jgi:hypothetical protein
VVGVPNEHYMLKIKRTLRFLEKVIGGDTYYGLNATIKIVK